MKRLIVASVMVVFGILVSIASASVPIGNCTLHAYQPSHYRGNWYGRGNIDNCFTFHDNSLTLQVCTQATWRGAKHWYTGGCVTILNASGFWLGTYRYPVLSTPQQVISNGVTYYVRTWDYGCAGRNCRVYVSPAIRA